MSIQIERRPQQNPQRAGAFTDLETRVLPQTYNEEKRTIEVVWTTGARVRRYDWFEGVYYEEELEVSAEAINMARFETGGMSVLDTHYAGELSAVVGVVERAWISGVEGRALLRLADTEDVADSVRKIVTGIVRNISVGYSVQKYQVTRAQDRTDGVNMPLYRAVRWTPSELSFVPVPADAKAYSRSQESLPAAMAAECEVVRANAHQSLENSSMTTQVDQPGNSQPAQPDENAIRAAAIEAERVRTNGILDLCKRAKQEEKASGWVAEGISIEVARQRLLDLMIGADEASGGHRNVSGGVVQTIRDERETVRAGMQESLMHRLNPRAELTDNGRQYRGLTTLDLVRDCAEKAGIKTRGMSPNELARTAFHTISDFPSLMANVANKRLRTSYEENPGTFRIWARQAPSIRDFKPITVAQLSSAPDLQQVNEHGEFKLGTMRDSGETYALATFGRIVTLTRQAIINDDLRAFDRLITAFGASAARLENRTVYSILTSNPLMADGVALFAAAGGARGQANITTGAGSALAIAGLTAARAAMRLMRDTNTPASELNVIPRYLIAPAALEHTAYQFTSSQFVPALASSVNEFREGGRTALTPIIEPLLDATSALQWYLAADSSQVDTVEYMYLEGAEGVYLESEMGFDIDGMSVKARLDFGAKAIDHRGLHRAAGA